MIGEDLFQTDLDGSDRGNRDLGRDVSCVSDREMVAEVFSVLICLRQIAPTGCSAQPQPSHLDRAFPANNSCGNSHG